MRVLSSIARWVLCFRSKHKSLTGLPLERECCCAAAGCSNSADTYAAITGGESFPALQGITDFFHCSAEVIAHVRVLEKRMPRRMGGRKRYGQSYRFAGCAPLLKHPPGLLGCPEWLLLGLEGAFSESQC